MLCSGRKTARQLRQGSTLGGRQWPPDSGEPLGQRDLRLWYLLL